MRKPCRELQLSIVINISARAPRQGFLGVRTDNTADALHDVVDHLLADGVVTTGIVVGSILLAADQQLGVEERAVVTGADLVDGGRVEVDKDGSGHVLAAARLVEKGLVGTAIADILGVGVRATVGSETVLKEVARFGIRNSSLTRRLRR